MTNNFFSRFKGNNNLTTQNQQSNLTNNSVPGQYGLNFNVEVPKFNGFENNTTTMSQVTDSNNRKEKLTEASKKFAENLANETYRPMDADFVPSMIDYSQYIGSLSPITQRYLYGGM